MKRFILILLALCAPLFMAADRRSVMRTYKPAAASSGLLIDENFEGTGTPAGWGTGTGTADFDNTSSPLAGAQDLKFSTTADSYVTNSITSSSEIWVTCKFKFSAGPASSAPILYGINNNVTKWGTLYVVTDGTLANGITSGITGSSTTDAMSTGTPYNLFLHIAKGTGANGVVDVEFSTTTRVGSGPKFTSISNADLDANITQFWVYNIAWGAGKTFQVDDVKVSNTGWPP